MSTDLLARMLRLLSLLQTRREWSGTELAGRLGVTVRTVRRDIDRLRELGYPVEGTTGHAGGYGLAAGTDMPPLLLDNGEAVTIAVALTTAAGELTGMEETALRALAKLEQVLPRRLRGQVTALREATADITWPAYGPRAEPATLTVLAAACRDHEIVTFDYTTRDGTPGPRRAEPQHLISSGGLWYLLAHDTHKNDWRIYRIDRITRPIPTGHRVPRRSLPGGNPAAFVADKIATAPARYRAVATVHAPADTVRARTWGALPGRIRPVDATSCTLDVSGDYLPRIAGILTGLDCDYTIDADPAVLDHLRAAGHRTLHATHAAPTPQPG
jgi:predicted DNA-binding transcriptional regulator YafY